jgi:uncharacterized damage-inducible protein DinB
MRRPAPHDFNPYYARYIERVPEGPLDAILEAQLRDTRALLDGVSAERAEYRYAPGKWSVKEVVGHLADVERIMGYRLLCAARGDVTPLPGFDENAYVPGGRFGRRTLPDITAELAAVRAATVALIRSLDEAALDGRITANGSPVTARAMAFIIAGHERHHLGVLRERYIPA